MGRSHRSSVASTVGWICWGGLEFDAKRIYRWLTEVAQLPGSMRTKAVLHTNEGWWSFNFADGFEELRPSGYRRDSRLEMLFEGEDFPDPDSIEAGLRACLSD